MRRELRQALPRDAAMKKQFQELATAIGVQGVEGEAGQ